MEGKYVVTMDLKSLHALKAFIGIVKEAGGSITINGEKWDNSSMWDDQILVTNIDAENIFAPSPLELERAKVVMNCEFGVEPEKSAACSLLESVSNFTGYSTRLRARPL